MNSDESYKVCPGCQGQKPFGDFYRDNSKAFSLTTYCKKCSDLKRKKYPLKNYGSIYYVHSKDPAKTKFKSLRTNCPKRGIEFKLNLDEFRKWYSNQERNCFYCGRQLSQFKKGDDGLTIDRLENAIGYEITNIVLCCWRCNVIKGYWFTSQEMIEIANKYLRKGERKLNRVLVSTKKLSALTLEVRSSDDQAEPSTNLLVMGLGLRYSQKPRLGRRVA